MNTTAVVMEEPERLALEELELAAVGDDDVVVDIEWSGISTGTERLLWQGRMPPFPGMGYPLVPGYESVGRIGAAGSRAMARIGERVFVPGANCFGTVRGLFGGAASRLVVPANRTLPIQENLGERGVLLALAATAYHATCSAGTSQPELVIGHGVLGRMVARLAVALGAKAPVVWETNPERRSGALGYEVIDPVDDTRHDYHTICDVSGDASILDTLVGRLAKGGEITLAGFYERPLSFLFPMAFMREARMRIAAQWLPSDLSAVQRLVESHSLCLDGLITHRCEAKAAPSAYRTAFSDPQCLKMILDWKGNA